MFWTYKHDLNDALIRYHNVLQKILWFLSSCRIIINVDFEFFEYFLTYYNQWQGSIKLKFLL